jgi:DNA-directed RNA polymerase specialized sigma24 family protein
MTRTSNPLHLLTAELEARSASPSGKRAMERFRRVGVPVGSATTMAELVAQCHADGAGSLVRAGEVVDGLLAAASSGPDAALCALVALRPALLRIARRTCGGEPDDDEVAEVVAIAWEEICGPAGSHGASVVVRAIWTRSRSALRRAADRAARETPVGDVLFAVDTGPAPDGNEAILATAVAQGVVLERDASLIALTRLGGMTIAELAAERGIPASTLTSRRRRAEAAIRRHLSEVAVQ